MIIISILAGLLSSMNVWTAKLSHIRFHLNDLYMACLMASWMIFLGGMCYGHYGNKVIFTSVFCIVLFVYLIKTQTFVNDTQFMKGMIPHHSMAILMSEKIKNKTNDNNIIKLADNIIESQNKEITLMKSLGY